MSKLKLFMAGYEIIGRKDGRANQTIFRPSQNLAVGIVGFNSPNTSYFASPNKEDLEQAFRRQTDNILDHYGKLWERQTELYDLSPVTVIDLKFDVEEVKVSGVEITAQPSNGISLEQQVRRLAGLPV